MSGYIYFIRPVGMTGPIKIGCSKVPESRLADLMRWSPIDLEIVAKTPGDFRLEKNIHDCLALHHSHKEWFHASPEVCALLDGLCRGIDLADLIDLSDRKGSIIAYSQRWSAEKRLYMGLTTKLRKASASYKDDKARELRIKLSEWGGKGTAPAGLERAIASYVENQRRAS